ncbi:uncharacterized protein G2W53_031938 [Senna tora]|uniref:Uncharacterized protein n=1 Tax=Senna tora TaxID=362788 RepID=A0A834SZL5_9FABA|nr:uncharacterized protein G2W53_031938 [Senna tora]
MISEAPKLPRTVGTPKEPGDDEANSKVDREVEMPRARSGIIVQNGIHAGAGSRVRGRRVQSEIQLAAKINH